MTEHRLVEERRDLPGLSAVFPGLERRRRRRSQRDLSAARHLVQLGIDAVWISPIFPPRCGLRLRRQRLLRVHPLFGSLADFDVLLGQAHARGLKVILDFVPNRTSEQHPWFRESRASKRNPKRDWYVWRDPKPDGSPPNNWESGFGGPAWTFDEANGQYYYHAYLKEQPDLDWRDPDVEAAMCDVLHFWFDRGVDRFGWINPPSPRRRGGSRQPSTLTGGPEWRRRAPAADPDDRSTRRARFDHARCAAWRTAIRIG